MAKAAKVAADASPQKKRKVEELTEGVEKPPSKKAPAKNTKKKITQKSAKAKSKSPVKKQKKKGESDGVNGVEVGGEKKKPDASTPPVWHEANDDFIHVDEPLEDKFTAAAGQMKIVSWNVNGLRALLKKVDLLQTYVNVEQPDVLCLQETKVDDTILSEFEGLLPGYEQFWSCCTVKKGYSGTAVFCKEAPLNVTYGIGIEEHDDEGRNITVEFEKFFLVNSYVVNSGQKLERLEYRQTWNADMLKYLDSLKEKKPVVWTGDLNCAHDEIDIHNPVGNKKTCGFTAEERRDFSTVLDSGYVDVFRNQNPVTPQYTFWGYRFNSRAKNKGWRLDYFLVSEDFMPSVGQTFVRGTVPGSDHVPIGLLITK